MIKAILIRSRGYCTFEPAYWTSHDICIEKIGVNVFSASTKEIESKGFRRAVIVGSFSHMGPSFKLSDQISLRNPDIVNDYCDDLASCRNIDQLLRLLQSVGPPEYMANNTSQFLVEVIDRRFDNVEGIPPHTDRTGCLFFAVLSSTMIGGAMSLYSPIEPRFAGLLRDGTGWYAEDSVTRICRLDCIAGSGYFVFEGSGEKGQKICHGCAPWRSPPSRIGHRRTLRIAFYNSQPV